MAIEIPTYVSPIVTVITGFGVVYFSDKLRRRALIPINKLVEASQIIDKVRSDNICMDLKDPKMFKLQAETIAKSLSLVQEVRQYAPVTNRKVQELFDQYQMLIGSLMLSMLKIANEVKSANKSDVAYFSSNSDAFTLELRQILEQLYKRLA